METPLSLLDWSQNSNNNVNVTNSSFEDSKLSTPLNSNVWSSQGSSNSLLGADPSFENINLGTPVNLHGWSQTITNNNNLPAANVSSPSYEEGYHPMRKPDFLDTSGRLDPDYWSDIFMRIDRENCAAVEKEYMYDHMFITPETVQLIFTICVRLEMPHEVRYLALFIYDEFMREQIMQTYSEVSKIENEEERDEVWSSASTRFFSQSTLRAVSSISIAIKCSYYRMTLTSNLLQRLLMVMSHTYDEKSILKSEHRVFSTIMYKVKITRNPIHIMETIICIMLSRFQNTLDFVEPDSLWEHAVLFMDLVYLNLETVYKRIWKGVHDKGDGNLPEAIILEREQTWYLETDFISLSLGVISVSAYSLYGNDGMQTVLNSLTTFTNVAISEIILFSKVVMELAAEQTPEQASIAHPSDLLGMSNVNVRMSPNFNLFD